MKKNCPRLLALMLIMLLPIACSFAEEATPTDLSPVAAVCLSGERITEEGLLSVTLTAKKPVWVRTAWFFADAEEDALPLEESFLYVDTRAEVLFAPDAPGDYVLAVFPAQKDAWRGLAEDAARSAVITVPASGEPEDTPAEEETPTVERVEAATSTDLPPGAEDEGDFPTSTAAPAEEPTRDPTTTTETAADEETIPTESPAPTDTEEPSPTRTSSGAGGAKASAEKKARKSGSGKKTAPAARAKSETDSAAQQEAGPSKLLDYTALLDAGFRKLYCPRLSEADRAPRRAGSFLCQLNTSQSLPEPWHSVRDFVRQVLTPALRQTT